MMFSGGMGWVSPAAETEAGDRHLSTGVILRRMGGLIRPYSPRLLVAFLLMLVASAATLVQPRIIQLAIDRGILEGHLRELNLYAAGYLATLALFWLAAYYQTWVLSWVGQRVLYDLRTRMFAHLQRLALRYYDREAIGHIISRNTSDVSALNEVLTQGLLQTLADFILVVGTIAIMFTMSVQLTLVTFVVLPALYVVSIWFARGSRPAYRRIRLTISAVNATLAENIVGMKIVQAFRREAHNFDEFSVVNENNVRAQKGAIFYHAGVIPILDVVDALATGLLLWVGGRWILGGNAPELTIGVLTAFMLYVGRFFEPIRDLATRYDQVQAALAASERILGLLDARPDVRDRPGAYDLPPIEGRARFEYVTFAYDGVHPVLKHVSLEAQPGERIALVGRTGAGKTTMIRLLMRFYDVQQGGITIDGHDLRDVTQHSLRRQMGLVLQEPFLFAGTIRENIAFGRPEASLEEIRHAARVVGLDDFIESLPGGYDAVVEERGSNLSGGQRQLLSLARAFLVDPRILILDEATSSVDTETEAAIQRALEQVMRGRTSFVIAHRLSTIKNATRILVLDQGQIVEQGTHQQLLELEGYYYKLYTLGFTFAEDDNRLLTRLPEPVSP